MRKYTLCIGLILMLSVIVITQLATASISNNVISAKVNIWPRLLCIRDNNCDSGCVGDSVSLSEFENLGGEACVRGRWIIALVRFPEKYSVKDIDPSTVTLKVMDGSVPVSKSLVFGKRILIAVFDRAAVIDLLWSMIQHMSPHAKQTVTFVVTGSLLDGKSFRGEDTIRVFLLN